MTIEQFIQQAREIEQNSTPGPWQNCEGGKLWVHISHGGEDACNPLAEYSDDVFESGLRVVCENRFHNALFIAHTKNTYKPLLDALEEALKALEDLRLAPWPDSHLFARDCLVKIQNILGAGE